MLTKAPPEILSPEDLAYMSTLNERDRRWFLATKSADLKAQGFSYRKVSKIMGTSTHTLQNGRQELLSGEGPGDGRIRRAGAGRKSVLPQHPEWTQAVVQIIEPHTAGLPQDENVVMIGNFKRDGKALCNGPLKSLDHDFSTFSDGQIVPHGIYDVTRNVGYMTLGISHDTSKFVCDNIARVWRAHLKEQYPDARTLVILCDGGGSNSSSHRIVKQDLMDLANKLGIRLLVVHYPPYCSKFNPIEHRLFSQITRSWSGAPLMFLQNAADRAAMTTTKKGLKVHVHINSKTHDIKRPI